MTGWKVVEYVQKGSNRRPLGEFYVGLGEEERTDFVAARAALIVYGNELTMPTSRPLGDGLFELRHGQVRIFYVFSGTKQAMLVHAYLKKTQKAPQGEIDIARSRAREVLK